MNTPIHLKVGYGQIDASWVNGTAIWVADYFARADPEVESQQLSLRMKNLAQAFERRKLFDPTIEILGTNLFAEDDNKPKLGRQLLHVTTYLIPYIDPSYLRPVMELRQAPPTPRQIEETIVTRDLRAGGNAVYNAFASAMHPHSCDNHTKE